MRATLDSPNDKITDCCPLRVEAEPNLGPIIQEHMHFVRCCNQHAHLHNRRCANCTQHNETGRVEVGWEAGERGNIDMIGRQAPSRVRAIPCKDPHPPGDRVDAERWGLRDFKSKMPISLQRPDVGRVSPSAWLCYILLPFPPLPCPTLPCLTLPCHTLPCPRPNHDKIKSRVVSSHSATSHEKSSKLTSIPTPTPQRAQRYMQERGVRGVPRRKKRDGVWDDVMRVWENVTSTT